MLLCGSFQNKVIRLINLLRFDEKLLSRAKESVAELPMKPESSLSSNDSLEGEEELQTEATSEEDDDDIEDIVDINNEVESVKRRDWRRVRKIYERSKQYIFVAATLPVNGKKTAGGILKHMFPEAKWVSGNYLHFHNPRCFTFFLFSYNSISIVMFYLFSLLLSCCCCEIVGCIYQELE